MFKERTCVIARLAKAVMKRAEPLLEIDARDRGSPILEVVIVHIFTSLLFLFVSDSSGQVLARIFLLSRLRETISSSTNPFLCRF